MTPKPPAETVGTRHIPRFIRHQRGLSAIGRRPVYGWSVMCSCGWKLRTNEHKRYVEGLHRQHVKEAGTP